MRQPTLDDRMSEYWHRPCTWCPSPGRARSPQTLQGMFPMNGRVRDALGEGLLNDAQNPQNPPSDSLCEGKTSTSLQPRHSGGIQLWGLEYDSNPKSVPRMHKIRGHRPGDYNVVSKKSRIL